jgi:dephospho-CoA kinase
MIVVGVTGGIGSGKSTVAAMLADRGAVVVDADQIAREVLEPGEPSYRALIDHFGLEVVGADGGLNRAALASRVFSDPAELAVLNEITHPAIAARIAARVVEYMDTNRVVVLDIPLLDLEAKSRFALAGVIVVDAPVELAVRRLVEHRGLSLADVRARVQAQIGPDERRRLGDVVVENAGTFGELEDAISTVWTWIQGLAPGIAGN